MKKSYFPSFRNLSFGTALFVFALLASASAVPVASWEVITGTGEDFQTDHPKFTTEESSIMSARIIPAITLKEVGKKLVFSGRVAFEIPENSGAAEGGFRWGVFESNGSGDERGWSGYFVGSKRGGNPNLHKKNEGGAWYSTTASNSGYEFVRSPDVTGGLSGRPLNSGEYDFEISLQREAEGVRVSWMLTSTGSSMYKLEGSWLDSAPDTQTFDRVGVQTTSDFGKTTAAFSNLKVTRP